MKKSKNAERPDSPVLMVCAIKNSPVGKFCVNFSTLLKFFSVFFQHQKYLRKTSEAQKDLLIQYFETHEGAIDIVSANNTDSEVKRRIWGEIAKILNKVEGGVEKNDLKWSKTWADMKMYAKNRARSAKQGHILANTRKPTDLDRRILKVAGNADLLRDWEASINEAEGEVCDKVRIDGMDHEIVVTEGTDYEYIDDEELVNVEDEQNVAEQEAAVVRIEQYYESEGAQYEYSEPTFVPVKNVPQSGKRKRVKHEDPQVMEMEDEEGQVRVTKQAKRQKQNSEDEDQNESESDHEDERPNDPMVGAINNLATALNNVASALSSFATIAKSFNKR